MDISMHINLRIGKKVQSPSLNHQKLPNYLNTMITCKVKKMAMQEEEKTNFYQLLALSSENIGFKDIKRAYRTMALRLHPDVCSSLTKEESTRRFVKLQKAYNTLSNPNSRQIYSNELSLVGNRERRGSFNNDVWETQLNELSKRSCDRMERKKNGVIYVR